MNRRFIYSHKPLKGWRKIVARVLRKPLDESFLTEVKKDDPRYQEAPYEEVFFQVGEWKRK